MKIRIITSHITCDGAVQPGTVIEVDDSVAVDYLNAKLAEPVKDGPVTETAVKKTSKEKATR